MSDEQEKGTREEQEKGTREEQEKQEEGTLKDLQDKVDQVDLHEAAGNTGIGHNCIDHKS